MQRYLSVGCCMLLHIHTGAYLPKACSHILQYANKPTNTGHRTPLLTNSHSYVPQGKEGCCVCLELLNLAGLHSRTLALWCCSALPMLIAVVIYI